MDTIEQYVYEGIGYNPLFIREGWQVAILNPLPRHGLDEIDRVEAHDKTDEVFILSEGTAVLIATNPEETTGFQTIRMKRGIIYNIPVGVWHNIAMDKDAKLFIVEKDNTHLHDCTYMELSPAQQTALREQIQNCIRQE